MVIGRFFGVSTHILRERAPAAITIVAKYIDILIPTTMLRKNLIEDVTGKRLEDASRFGSCTNFLPVVAFLGHALLVLLER